MRHMPTLLPPLRGATPSNSDPSGRDTRESTSSRRGSPAKPLVRWGGAKAIGMRRARSFSTSSNSVGSCGPPSWSSNVCGPFSKTPSGWNRSEYFRSMGYGLTIRKEQASDYLAQVRTRGILTATKHDYWHLATGPLRALFSGTPPPRPATVGSARVLGPHPPRDSPLYRTDAQARCYSPARYLGKSWPWKGYTRVLKRDSVLSTILKSYGKAAEIFPASEKGWHELFADTPHRPRFLHPTELAVAQGFLWGFPLPTCPVQAWQLIGNSIPPPMAYLGLLGPAATLQGWGLTGGGRSWAADGFHKCCHASDGAWEAVPNDLGPAQEGQGAVPPESTHLTRAEAHNGATVLAMSSPRKKTPQVAMTRGRKMREGELPTTVWMDPSSKEEERDLLVALHALPPQYRS